MEIAIAGRLPRRWRRVVAIELTCRAGHRFRIREVVAGRAGRCPQCGDKVLIPGDETLAVKESSADQTVSGGRPAGAGHTAGPSGSSGSTRSSQLDRFELIEAVGEGGFGTVYRARDPQLRREVALKIPRAGALTTPEAVDRFLREARAAAQLQHPHIVAVHDAGRFANTYFIASTFVEGNTLKQALAERGRFSCRQAALLVSQLAAALHYAHNRGVIHRDVKPANVMLDPQGEPHIMDFGLARRNDGDALQTMEGTLMGTPAYMSPEQAQGKSHLADARSDLWSLGVILYELLTGKRPFTGEGGEVLVAVRIKEPDPPRKLDKSIPKDLETIALKCLAKDPEARYPSCQHLAEELQRWLRGEPISARRIGPVERAARWSRRNPVVAGLTSVVALLLVAVALVLVVSNYRLQRQQTTLQGALAFAKKSLRDEEQATKRLEQTVRDLEQEKKDRARAEANTSAAVNEKKAAESKASAAETKGKAAEKKAETAEGQLVKEEAGRRAAEGMAETTRKENYRLWSRLALKQGLALCLQGDEKQGMLWLARALELNPPDAADLDRVLRANLGTWRTQRRPRRTLTWPVDAANDRERVIGQSPVAFSPSGEFAVTGAAPRGAAPRGAAVVWNLATGKPVPPPLASERGSMLKAVAFSPAGDLLLTANGKGARVWNTKNGKPSNDLLQDTDVEVLAIRHDGKRAIMGGKGTYVFRNLENLKIIRTIRQADKPYADGCAAFSPDGKWVVWSELNRLAFGDGTTGKEVQGPFAIEHPGDENAAITAVAFDRDGKRLLTASKDGKARLWDLENRTFKVFVHKDDVTCAAISSDGSLVLTGSRDATARIWDAATGELYCQPYVHDKAIHSVAFSPDGKTFLTATLEKSAQLWDVPAPRTDSVEAIVLQVQIGTEMSLDENGEVRTIPTSDLDDRIKQLQAVERKTQQVDAPSESSEEANNAR